MKYRSKDIAKIVGVSPATMSLIVNNKPGVSSEKRKEIIRKMKELNCEYLLKETDERGTIGFVIYKKMRTIIDEYPFFSYLLENINQTVRSFNYKLDMIYIDSVMPLNEQLRIINNTNLAGLIVYAVEMKDPDVKIFGKTELPCVFVDNSFRQSEVSVVSIDNYLGVFQALNHLFQMGHREIGYIKSKISITSFEERFEAFSTTLAKLNLKLNPEHVMHVGYSESETIDDVIAYLNAARSLPTAFFADNDLLACRAVNALKSAGHKIPDDISIVGFDNRPVSSYVEPAVTTIAIPREEMGNVAVKTLMEEIEGKRRNSIKSMIGTKLIVRKSVKKLTILN